MLDSEENCDHPGMYLLESLQTSSSFLQLISEADAGDVKAMAKMEEVSGALQSLVFYLEATGVGEVHEERVNYELAEFYDLVKDYLV